MKSKSDDRSTRSVPPLFALEGLALDERPSAGEAKPAATSNPTPIASAAIESQSLLCIGLLSMDLRPVVAGLGDSILRPLRRSRSSFVSKRAPRRNGPRGRLAD